MGKCTDCKRKLPLTAYACKCNLYYCSLHMGNHKCSYDYYKKNKESILKHISTTAYTKKETMLSSI